MDGRVDIVFSARAGGEGAHWNAGQQSCAVYCHGDARPVWTVTDGSQARCGSCHGIPPGGEHPQSEAACGACHPATVREDGTINLAGGAHVNGRVDRGGDVVVACGSCHGIPPGGGHTTSTSCGSCHEGYSATTVNAALHQNGRTDVTAQACGSCHAIPPSTGEHAEHVGEGISCGRCHEGASTASGGAGHMNGIVNVNAPGWNAGSRSCSNSCHGTERWDGGHDGGDD
jgi:predicted CxxxxCH...CXXCH cytochrome family protein